MVDDHTTSSQPDADELTGIVRGVRMQTPQEAGCKPAALQILAYCSQHRPTSAGAPSICAACRQAENLLRSAQYVRRRQIIRTRLFSNVVSIKIRKVVMLQRPYSSLMRRSSYMGAEAVDAPVDAE